MLSYDFSPLYRTAVGFDRLARLAEAATRHDSAAASYPPYNIEKAGENAYRITLAVAGFSESDLEIEVKESTLTITGKRTDAGTADAFLYKGIAGRDFVRRFELADHVKVTGANLDNGLLTVDLVREIPEAMKPRTIEIKPGAPAGIVDKAKTLLGKGAEKKAA